MTSDTMEFDLPELNVDLDLVTDGQGQLRSDDAEQFFQTNSSGRRISGRLVHAVHGFLDGKTGDDATHASLIVLRFRMTSTNDDDEKRRWKRFYLQLRFEMDSDPLKQPAWDPWVKAYAPGQNGTIYLTETRPKDMNSKTYTVGANARAPLPAELGVEVNAERKKAKEYESRYLHTVEAGREETETAGGGRHGEDIVYWNLRENKKEKVGVADEIQVAILLVRPRKGHNFSMHYHPEATIDLWYRMSDSWKEVRGQKSASLHFDVSKDINKPEKLDKTNLGAVRDNKDKELNDLAYIHIPENFLPKQSYSDDGQLRERAIVIAAPTQP